MLPNCERCPIGDGITVDGDGPHDTEFALIGEAPGEQEERAGIPFVGPAGKEIDKLLSLADLDRGCVYVDNVVACRPPSAKGNKKPAPSAVTACSGRLEANLRRVDPDVVILLGATPVGALGGGLSLKSNHGLVFKRMLFGRERKLVVMYHPAAALHQPSLRATIADDWLRLRERLNDTGSRFVKVPYTRVRKMGTLFTARDVAVDCETSHLDAIGSELVRYSVATEKGVAWQSATNPTEYRGFTIGWNLKYDFQVLRRYGHIFRDAKLADGMIAAYLCGEPALGLKGMTKRYLNYEMHSLTELLDKAQDLMLQDYLEQAKHVELPKNMQKSLQVVLDSEEPAKALSRRWRLRQLLGEPPLADVRDVDRLLPDELMEYGCDDASATRQLWPLFERRLKEIGLERLFWNVEMPLVPILANVELRGLEVDRKRAAKLSRQWAKLQDGLLHELNQEGVENPASPQQVARAVFGKWGHEPVAYTDTGQPSTAAWILEQLSDEDPRITWLLDWRKYEKLRNTYLDKWCAMEGRVHPEFNQVRQHGEDAEGATVTGRLSSSGPNFQNIPKRTEEGREVRSCIVAGPGNVLISADYRQLEWVLMGIGAKSRRIMDAYVSGADIHAFNTEAIGLAPSERDTGKRVTYLWVYGGRAGKLAQVLRIPRTVAERYLQNFERAYPELYEWRWNEVEKAKTLGYATTLWGRRRYIPELASARSEYEFYEAAKQAFNMFPQGTAADIAKLGCVRVDNYLRSAGVVADHGIVAQVHDEVLVEIPKKALTKRLVCGIIESLQSAGEGLPLTLGVEAKTGERWGSLLEYTV